MTLATKRKYVLWFCYSKTKIQLTYISVFLSFWLLSNGPLKQYFKIRFSTLFQKYQHSVKISHSNRWNPDQFGALSGLIWIHTICFKFIATSKSESLPIKVNTYINFTASDLGIYCLPLPMSNKRTLGMFGLNTFLKYNPICFLTLFRPMEFQEFPTKCMKVRMAHCIYWGVIDYIWKVWIFSLLLIGQAHFQISNFDGFGQIYL